MDYNDTNAFSQALNRIHIMYKQTDAPQSVTQVYFDYLKKYVLVDVLNAMIAAMQDVPEFFPTAPKIGSYLLAKIRLLDKSHESLSDITALIEQGKAKRRAGQTSTMLTVDTGGLTPDPAREVALRRCPPPDDNTDRIYWANRYRSAYAQALDEINSGSRFTRIENAKTGMIDNKKTDQGGI